MTYIFQTIAKPDLLDIEWGQAEVGKALFYTWEEIYHRDNIAIIIDEGRKRGITMQSLSAEAGVAFFVTKSTATLNMRKGLPGDLESAILEAGDDGITVAELKRRFSNDSPVKIDHQLRQMEEYGDITSQPYQNPQGGRPTTLWKAA